MNGHDDRKRARDTKKSSSTPVKRSQAKPRKRARPADVQQLQASAGNALTTRGIKRRRPPFAFRYSIDGPPVMTTLLAAPGGLVQYPAGGLPSAGDAWRVLLVKNAAAADLPTETHRAIGQSAVMGIGPNDAARLLRLAHGAWEWLHLVAFSIAPTHVDALSAKSMTTIDRTGQPQQISENLVLGTAAANTAMLSYETVIKSVLRKNPALRLDLFVSAHKRDHVVQLAAGPVTVPAATRIDYHLNFRNGELASAPVVLAFDSRSHHRPSQAEYAAVEEALEAHASEIVAGRVEGLRTEGFTALERKSKRRRIGEQ